MGGVAGLLLVWGTPTPAVTWVSSWGAAQQVPEPRNEVAAEALQGATLRQIVRLSVGGPSLRVRVSNAFGVNPLHLLAVHVARPVSAGSSQIEAGSDRALGFGGRAETWIPAGAEYLSDPLDYPVKGLSLLAVTLQIEAMPGTQTGHPGSRTTSYLVRGAAVNAPELAGAERIDHWYFLSGIEVAAGAEASCVVVLGDSITDGRGSTTNGNDRWTDVLAARLLPHGIGVVNAGIGGNRLLADGLGPSALARFDRDVLARPGVRQLIVLEGINDLGTLAREAGLSAAQHEEGVRRVTGAYQQLVERAHAQHIQVIGATLLPWMGNETYPPDELSEGDRQAVNRWIRAPGHFDAVLDFEKVTADEAHPERLRPGYDSGDHLHPSPAGYRAMGEAVPLRLLEGRRSER